MGIYLLSDDKQQTTTTIYFLNEEPHRKFHTIEEYGILRDRFLKTYTTCIHESGHSNADCFLHFAEDSVRLGYALCCYLLGALLGVCYGVNAEFVGVA